MADHASPSHPAWAAVADVTGIGPGTRVLDVGCGTGGFCALAAERGAVVHGIDAMPERVAEARRRVPGGDFRVELMEQLPWPAGSFDVVTGFNAFQYALDVELALTEACRVAEGGWSRSASTAGRRTTTSSRSSAPSSRTACAWRGSLRRTRSRGRSSASGSTSWTPARRSQ